MEAVLKNMEVTVELVGVARHSGCVGLWDGPTLSRAFQWAGHCELLFHRFSRRRSIRTLMERRLETANRRLRTAVPGYRCLSFTELAHLQDLLLLGLLSNPEPPPALVTTLCESRSTRPLPTAQRGDVRGMWDALIGCKAACRLLGPLTDPRVGGPGVEVQADMLMERLEDLLSHGSDTQRAEHLLRSLLLGCEGAEQHFCRVMVAALLREGAERGGAERGGAGRCVERWLCSEQRVLLLTCSTLSAKLLSQLAKRHHAFTDAYLSTLHGWAALLDYSVEEGAWLQTSTDPPSLSFQELTQHFTELCEACSSLRENVLERLTSRNTSRNTSDVEGLSVWADLRTALLRGLS